MPEGNVPVLVVRVTDVLDRSKHGVQAADVLRARFTDARRKREAISDPVEGARFETDFARELEAERERHRDALLTRAAALAETIRLRRGALVVVDASVVLAADTNADITGELIAALDAAPAGDDEPDTLPPTAPRSGEGTGAASRSGEGKSGPNRPPHKKA